MLKTIEFCPACKSKNFTPFLVCKDYTVTNESFTILSCQSCGFKFTNPRPTDDTIGTYYKSETYISHSNTNKGLVAKLYKTIRTYTLKKKLALVNANVPRGTILDYGCGTGMFLKTCQDNQWKAFGTEPDNDARNLASQQGLTVFSDKARLQTYITNEQFDAITLWHVLEHVTDLDETLTFFKNRLKPNGVLIIAVPNHKSYDAIHYGSSWAAYDVPRHIYHFEPATLQKTLANYGFVLKQMKPMKFDSFYVSLLSEKYKTGKTNYWQAFITGLKSNLKAKEAGAYSSVIYIFKQK